MGKTRAVRLDVEYNERRMSGGGASLSTSNNGAIERCTLCMDLSWLPNATVKRSDVRGDFSRFKEPVPRVGLFEAFGEVLGVPRGSLGSLIDKEGSEDGFGDWEKNRLEKPVTSEEVEEEVGVEEEKSEEEDEEGEGDGEGEDWVASRS